MINGSKIFGPMEFKYEYDSDSDSEIDNLIHRNYEFKVLEGLKK